MGNLQRASFQKNKLFIGVGFLGVFVLLAIAAAPMILASISADTENYVVNEKDFPLETDLDKTVFSLGDKVSFNATITNRSGRDVNVSSNGAMPCVFFHHINDNTPHGEITMRVDRTLKAGEKISRAFEFMPSENGTYILDVHYRVDVNNVSIQDKQSEIIIEVE